MSRSCRSLHTAERDEIERQIAQIDVWLHESGTYVKLTKARAALLA